MAERAGTTPSTLRSWDRRYGVGPSDRTNGNHRRYTHLDVLRVLTMGRLIGQGVPAQAAATSVLSLTDDDLLEENRDAPLIASAGPRDRSAAGAGVARSASSSAARGTARSTVTTADPAAGDGAPRRLHVADVDDEVAAAAEEREARETPVRLDGSDLVDHPTVRALLAATRALDAPTIAHLTRQVLRRHEVGAAWDDVLAPTLRAIGRMWELGELGVDAEHLVSELLGSELRAVARTGGLRVAATPILLGAADEEQHHLPLLALEAALAGHGQATMYLGPRLPSSALARAITRTHATSVFLWASISRRPQDVLWDRLIGLEAPVHVVLGGPGWTSIPVLPARLHVEVVGSMREAVTALAS
ncbi:MerR family transcriptional regulator [Lapillicoccus jejuensis]|uniref:MerR family transcriptional regulator n=1 Tax=Lapillicoccus jejuensis TaxID=402171 RepID=UPI001B86220E|nr:MerR family transcriptional regulator [Lapillicoccus jejuensis]